MKKGIVQEIIIALRSGANPERAAKSPGYFKTFDEVQNTKMSAIYLGTSVPDQRAIAKDYYGKITQEETLQFLYNDIHECRLTAIFILIMFYEKQKKQEDKMALYELVMKNLDPVNSWDLTDSLAPKIIGPYLYDKDRKPLYELALSGQLWRQRIAMVSTQYFIKKKDYNDVIGLALLLLHHPHDMIHKAVGWMLKEMSQKDRTRAEDFLDLHYNSMPRTMLRVAIEKFPEPIRQAYLKGVK